MKEILLTQNDAKKAYVSPTVKAFTFGPQSIICNSASEGTGENGGMEGGFGNE